MLCNPANILQGACFTVGNLYYNQPILNKIAETFDVSYEKASSVATLMQSGYAAGLLFLCPLGDIVRRRPFILGLTWATALLVSLSTTAPWPSGPPSPAGTNTWL